MGAGLPLSSSRSTAQRNRRTSTYVSDDGVLVVPRGLAEEAIVMAEDILRLDKLSRRAKYEALGLPPDDSVA